MRHEALKADGNQNDNSNLARARAWITAVKPHRRRIMPTSRWSRRVEAEEIVEDCGEETSRTARRRRTRS
eukprot:840082-Heterocapsa_arctica.AAC.1